MATIKGICRNEECDMCDQIQEVEKSNFKCECCGKELIPFGNTTKQKGSSKKLIIGIVAAVVIIGGILAAVFAGGGKTKSGNDPEIPVVDSDSIRAAQLAEQQRQQNIQDSLQAVADSIAAEQARQDSIAKAQSQPAAPRVASGSKDLGYATFKGSWPNDVNARMVFKSSHLIDSRDPKQRVAELGDYVIGEWSDGHLVQGIWYGPDNVVKGSIIIGK